MESLCSFENLLRLSDGRITMVCHVAKDILGTMVIRCDDCSVTFGRVASGASSTGDRQVWYSWIPSVARPQLPLCSDAKPSIPTPDFLGEPSGQVPGDAPCTSEVSDGHSFSEARRGDDDAQFMTSKFKGA